MHWKSSTWVISLVILSGLIQGCIQSEYTKLVRTELSKGVRYDSLLFGINLGDSRDEFYGKCYDLNKQKLITQGPNGATVQYLFTDSLVHSTPTPLMLLFIPAFDDQDKIIEMNLEFSYVGWAPWNKELSSEVLKDNVLRLLENWYRGNPFMMIEIDDVPVPVKLDGNRRMLVYIKDEQNVVVKIHDILHPRYRHSTTDQYTTSN